MIKYLSAYYHEVERQNLENCNSFSIAVKNNNGFCCSVDAKGSLDKVESKIKKLLKDFPQCTIAEIRDTSKDSNRTYGPYGLC